MNTIVKFTDVSFSYNSQEVLKNVSFSIDEREFVFLTGKSGCGKSTLSKLIYGALTPSEGTIETVGYKLPLEKKKNLMLLRRKLGVVFQEFRLLKDRNVGDNLSFVMQVAGNSSNAIKRKVNDALSEVGLFHKLKAMPDTLSGGELQRVAIARAMINDPLLILADEPTGNLDPETSNEIFELLKKINANGTGVMVATHNYEYVRKSDFRILRLEKSTITQIQRSQL